MKRSSLWHLGCVLGTLVLVAGCNNYDLSAVDSFEPTYQDFSVNLGNKKVDVLFVVDNSGSMDTEQATLARSISGFISNFTGKPIDYHIGVITTDTVMDPNGSVNVWQSNGVSPVLSGSSQMHVPLSTFGIFDGPGSLFLRNIGFDGSTLVDRSAAGFNLSNLPKYLDSKTQSPNAIAAAFNLNAMPGINGSGNEASLLSLSKFLQPDKLAGWNAGFLRPDSLFSVVILTDEDESMTDCDATSIDPYLASQACIDRHGAANDYIQNVPDAKAARVNLFTTLFKAQRPKHPALLSFDTVLALEDNYPNGSGCAGGATHGDLLQEVTQSLNSDVNKSSKIHDICVNDFSTSISSIGNVLATSVENRFGLDADKVDPNSIHVVVNGNELQDGDFSYDSATNVVSVNNFEVDTSTLSGSLSIRIYYQKQLDLTDK